MDQKTKRFVIPFLFFFIDLIQIVLPNVGRLPKSGELTRWLCGWNKKALVRCVQPPEIRSGMAPSCWVSSMNPKRSLPLSAAIAVALVSLFLIRSSSRDDSPFFLDEWSFFSFRMNGVESKKTEEKKKNQRIRSIFSRSLRKNWKKK